jgi:hypothetical protein
MFGSIPSGNMELIGEIRCDEEGEEQEEQVAPSVEAGWRTR